MKLSQVKRVKTFCLRSVTLGEKIQKEETKKNKIRLHPNIVLLTLVIKGLLGYSPACVAIPHGKITNHKIR